MVLVRVLVGVYVAVLVGVIVAVLVGVQVMAGVGVVVHQTLASLKLILLLVLVGLTVYWPRSI